MIEKIRKIYLYADDTKSSSDAKEWLDNNKVSYDFLWYGDKNQHPEVFGAVNTWTFGNSVTVNKFPFVVYSEIHDTGDVVMQCLLGLNNIKNSNLVELLELG
jgi:hypothetical protein